MSSKEYNKENLLDDYERMEFNKYREDKKEVREAALDYFREKPIKKNNETPKKKRNIKGKFAAIGVAAVVLTASIGTAYSFANKNAKQEDNPELGISRLINRTNADKAIKDAKSSINLYVEASNNINNAHVNNIFTTGDVYMAEMQNNETNQTYKIPIDLADEHKEALDLIEKINHDIIRGKDINKKDLDKLRAMIPKLNQLFKDRQALVNDKNEYKQKSAGQYTYSKKKEVYQNLNNEGINTTLLEKEDFEDEYERD